MLTLYTAFLLAITPQHVEIAPKPPQFQEFTVTWYSAVETCSNRCTMADGTQAYVGAAACPRNMPFGTKIRFENGSEYVCHDRTSKKYNGRVDLFAGYEQSSYEYAIQQGIQTRKAEVIYP